jgi:hypothetical protein
LYTTAFKAIKLTLPSSTLIFFDDFGNNADSVCHPSDMISFSSSPSTSSPSTFSPTTSTSSSF